jgi:outer membrane protein TolC
VLLRPDGTLLGDMFDGTGFVRGLAHKGFVVRGARCLVAGAGGVGSAIAASLAAAGAGTIALLDLRAATAEALAGRLRKHYPSLDVRLAGNDPAGYDLVVNGTPLGMNADDPLVLQALQTRDTLFQQIATEYYTYSLNLKVSEAQQRQLEILQKKLRSVRGQFREGMSPKKDFLRFKTQVQRSEIEVLTARLNIDKSLLELQRMLGAPTGSNLAFQPMEPLVDAPKIPGEPPPVERAYEHRIASREVKLGALQVAQAKRDYWPNVNLAGGLSYANPNYLNSPYGFNANRQLVASVELQLSFNLWDWGQRRDNIALARNTENVYENSLRTAENQVRADTRTLMLTLTQLKANYALSEELLSSEETTYEVILRDYEEGRVQYLDLINSLSSLLDAKLKVYTSYFEVLKGLTRYHYYNGSLYETLIPN